MYLNIAVETPAVGNGISHKLTDERKRYFHIYYNDYRKAEL